MLSQEIKYIIVKDKNNHLRHYKSDYLHHSIIARNNGYNESEVIEAGLFLDKELYILECISAGHIQKRAGHYIGNRLNFYQDKRLEAFLKGRELESQLYYSKKAVGLRPGGD